MPNCELCGSEVNVVALSLDDRFEEEGRTDWVALRRMLSSEHGLETTVSALKRHVEEHINWATVDDLDVEVEVSGEPSGEMDDG